MPINKSHSPDGEWLIAYKIRNVAYIKSSALAKKVTLKGSTMEQYDPNGDHSTAKKATTEIKNNIQ